ncbi:MAG TPA: DUF389 domain-containing protein [Burkholderiaceae bacterium]|nr:DUF389 domain-containing protein [Burkholderiaceae bacterium]
MAQAWKHPALITNMLTLRDTFRRFDLRQDQASTADIDSALRAGARAGGTNLWVLFFAILIASVGLNVNSTAVIIGAMLISPLMAPIVGVGYGAAISDLKLMRSSASTLLGFTLVSLLTSIVYFSLSPLDEPSTEMMARTSPNLWDVLIAAFGGAAGMVAATRRSFTNIAPGVAIATALMPPLCTVGFGLAHQRWDMAAGAFYLFLINSIFIASATLLVGRILRLPKHQDLSERTVKLHRWVIAACLLAVLIPSVWQGYRFVQHEFFRSAANASMRMLMQSERSIIQRDIDVNKRRINLVVVGLANDVALKERAISELNKRGVQQVEVSVVRPDSAQWEEQGKRSLARDDAIHQLVDRIDQLQKQVTDLQKNQTDMAIKGTNHNIHSVHKGK